MNESRVRFGIMWFEGRDVPTYLCVRGNAAVRVKMCRELNPWGARKPNDLAATVRAPGRPRRESRWMLAIAAGANREDASFMGHRESCLNIDVELCEGGPSAASRSVIVRGMVRRDLAASGAMFIEASSARPPESLEPGRAALVIAEHHSQPTDIEWVVDSGGVWVTQMTTVMWEPMMKVVWLKLSEPRIYPSRAPGHAPHTAYDSPGGSSRETSQETRIALIAAIVGLVTAIVVLIAALVSQNER